MIAKRRVAILCGGCSVEHEVSIESAKNIIQALDKDRNTITVIYITQKGKWCLLDSPDSILNNEQMRPLPEIFQGLPMLLRFGNEHPFVAISQTGLTEIPIDVIFPVIHGSQGEDGTLQGLLDIANVPYVGAGTLSSAVCMDKDVAKRLLAQAEIPVAPWIIAENDEIEKLTFDAVVEKLGVPFFIKPVNAGSSVGVSKVKNKDEFEKAISLAGQYDHKIILEKYIAGREIECAVLGNQHTQASLPGEIILHHEFYSYDAKYIDPNGASLKFPAELSLEIIEKIQQLAKKVFSVLCCDGMARVDFFLTADGEIFLNEANTIPGFTQISMYPKLWSVSGLDYSALINSLIELAFIRFQRKSVLHTEKTKESVSYA